MDRTDLLILAMLSQNPLIAYREMATSLKVSVPAIHRRVQVLHDKGILGRYQARIPMSCLRATSVHFVGRSSASSVDKVMTDLSKNDSVRSLLITSGNMLFIHAELRSLDALDQFSEFAKGTSMIGDPRIGIDSAGEDKAGGEELTPLDLRIIRSMHNDARKSTVDIADELGISARTVRSHLDKMIENCLIELSTEIDPTYSEDTSSILRMFLKEGTDKRRLQATILHKHFPQVLYCQSFVNIPDFTICATITKTPKDLKRLLEQIQSEEGLRSMESNIAITGRYFDTWRDKLVDKCDKDGAQEIASMLSKKK